MTDAKATRLAAMFRSRAFWSQLAPDLAIRDDCPFEGTPWPLPFSDEADFRAQLDREGYVQLPRLLEHGLLAKLSATIAKLAAVGVPPVFAMVFDDFWMPAFRLGAVVRAAFGAEFSILPALWVWHVDPSKSEAGWRPHRELGHKALFLDRRPKSLSAWIAITEATPLNGCMYVVPADRDPTYGTADDGVHKFGLPEIRALPAEAGDVFLWNQALLHWGSHASPRASTPRMSMAFEYVRRDVEPSNEPPIEPASIRRFEDRLHLIAMQIVRYRHLYSLPEQMEAVARLL